MARSEEVKPFNKLNEQEKRVCVDIAIGMAVIAARAPAFSTENFKGIADAWAKSAGLDDNLCRYALRDVTNELCDLAWDFHVSKEGIAFTTQFMQRKNEGGNGESDILLS